MEESKKEVRRTYQESQNRERKLGGETNPKTENRIRKNTGGRKEEGKMQNKRPILTQENQDIFVH